MPNIQASKLIEGVQIVTLKSFADERGYFIETFRKEWFPQRSWEIVQTNRSNSKAGVLRGLHYHFRQVDYWYVVAGKIRTGLFDLRTASPTYGATQTLELGEDNQLGLFIPVGVAHGFVALTDATLTYVVDNYYDSQDEYGIAWNDPDIALPWGVESPMVSPRDAANPFLHNIPPQKIPDGH
ncbi:MAG: dTDP-4-dehydrorhamnose 3,5-epimerase family protein [Anaerolineae bacterium]|nr:dTDP-4-dehydrorhamnose 3,5-epimerase family protein [Anaerolineae bacterium]